MSKQGKILVVDDFPALREYIKENLEDAGHAVEAISFNRWEEAAEIIEKKAKTEQWDLLALDIHFDGDREQHWGGVWLYNDLLRRGVKKWKHTIIYSKYVPDDGELKSSGEPEAIALRVFMDTAGIGEHCALPKIEMRNFNLSDKVKELIG